MHLPVSNRDIGVVTILQLLGYNRYSRANGIRISLKSLNQCQRDDASIAIRDVSHSPFTAKVIFYTYQSSLGQKQTTDHVTSVERMTV